MVLFNIGFCDIFLIFMLIFIVILIILVILTVQYCGNSLFTVFFKWFETWPRLFESRLVLIQD